MPAQTLNATNSQQKKSGTKFSLELMLSVVLVLISCLLYANTLKNGYVMDDGLVVSENRIVQKGISGIPELFTTPHMYGRLIAPNDMYRPLSLILFAIEYQYFGLDSLVGHLCNVLLFAACVVLLFRFLDKFFDHRKTVIAFIAALLFAVHPIHTEVVANIKSSDELLCFLFAFLSLIFFLDYMKKGNAIFLAVGLVSLSLSFLSKETVITFLGVVPILVFLYGSNKTRAAFVTGGTVLVSVLFIAVRWVVLAKYHANQPTPVLFIDNALASVPQGASRFATEVVILGRYLWLMFVPYPLLCDYSFNSIPFASFSSIGFWCSLIAYAFLVYIVISRWAKDKSDPWAFGIFFFIATIFLFSNIPFLMGAELAERFAFFPSVGFCLIAALAVEKWLLPANATVSTVFKNIKVLAVLIPVLVLFSSMTIMRNEDWKDEYTLFSKDSEKSPDNSRLWYFRACAIIKQDGAESDTIAQPQMDEECIGYLRRAIAVYPGFSQAHRELGTIFDNEHMYDSSAAHVKMALESVAPDAVADNNEGTKYYARGRYPLAIYLYRKAIVADPGSKYPWYSMGLVYNRLKEFDSAIFYFNRSLVIDPQNIDARYQLAASFYGVEKLDSVEYQMKQILLLKPNDVSVMNDMGSVFAKAQNYARAIGWFQKTISIDANNIVANNSLGYCYYESHQYPEALVYLGKVIAVDPQNNFAIAHLAQVYHKTGSSEQAAKYEAMARQTDPGFRFE